MIGIWLEGTTMIALPLGLAIGLAIGLMVDFSYSRLSADQKKSWEDHRLAHHYVLGIIAAIIGIVFSPFLVGIGFGLIVTDLPDLIKKWQKRSDPQTD